MAERFVSNSIWKLEQQIASANTNNSISTSYPSNSGSLNRGSKKDDSITLKSYTSKDHDNSPHNSNYSNPPSVKYKSIEKNMNLESEGNEIFKPNADLKIETVYSDCERKTSSSPREFQRNQKKEIFSSDDEEEKKNLSTNSGPLIRKSKELSLPPIPTDINNSLQKYNSTTKNQELLPTYNNYHRHNNIPIVKINTFRWLEVGVKRILFFLGKTVPKHKILFTLLPLIFSTLSIIGPIIYYNNLSLTIPFPTFMNHNEKSGSTVENYRIGGNNLGNNLNFNSTNPMFNSFKKTSQAEFSILISTIDQYDTVLNSDVIDLYQQIRSNMQKLRFTPSKDTKYKWKDVCREDCSEKNELVKKLLDKELLLRYPEAVMRETFNNDSDDMKISGLNISRIYIANLLGDIIQDSEGIVSRARTLQLNLKMKDNLKNEIFEEYEKNFRNAVEKERIEIKKHSLELNYWSVRKYVVEVLDGLENAHYKLFYCAITLITLCFFSGFRKDSYQSRPFFGIQIALVLIISIGAGIFVQITGVGQYYTLAFLVSFPIIQIGLVLFYSMLDSWSRYCMAALHPVEKLVFILSWDGPVVILSLLIIVIATCGAGTFAINQHLQYSLFIIGASFAIMLVFALFYLTLCMYTSGKKEAEGVKWYQFCRNGDDNFNEKTLPDFDENFFNVLHEKLTDYKSSKSRIIGRVLSNANVRSLVVFAMTIYIIIGVWGFYQTSVDLKEEHFVNTNTTSYKFMNTYRKSFKKSDNYLEIVLNAPLDYYDRVKKEEILSLLRWPLDQQYATKAVSWLMDFERFQHTTVYDVNADTIVPIVSYIFLQSDSYKKYSTDIVFDKFNTQIIKSRMYLEMSSKGSSEQLKMISGILELAKKYNLPITLKTPFIFSLQHDLQLSGALLTCLGIICGIVFVMTILFFNNPAMALTCLLSNIIAVLCLVGYSYHFSIPLNILTGTAILMGILFNTVSTIHFVYNYTNSGFTHITSGARIQYAFQCTLMPVALASVITGLTFVPLLSSKIPLIYHMFCIIFLSSIVTIINILLFVPSSIIFLTESVATCCVKIGQMCEEPMAPSCIIEQPGDGIYIVSNGIDGRISKYYNGNIITPIPTRHMIMPPPDYEKSSTTMSRKPKRIPSSRIGGNFNDSFENDESIYEEPQTPPPNKKRSTKSGQQLTKKKHIETLSKQAMENDIKNGCRPEVPITNYRYNYPQPTGAPTPPNPMITVQQMNAWRAINFPYPQNYPMNSTPVAGSFHHHQYNGSTGNNQRRYF
ncbi:Patched family-containing protein [Strongyloides ratti]|uniref:Patched family-containing protein n=1 Tax=Strongyloides ratti TaxID=34506 RepID=A0A090LFQ9_STRRB|nr:Patched family-containing protein [Strongyloides ratti]CEF68621.1 Patched family-containing protein [Strongyloides ratti]